MYAFFFLIQCFLGCYIPLSLFQSSGKVGTDVFCVLSDVSTEGWVWSCLLCNFANVAWVFASCPQVPDSRGGVSSLDILG